MTTATPANTAATADDILTRDTFGAFCRHTHVALAPTGRGVLDGLTFGLKDLYDVAGARTGFGSPDWLRTHAPASHTSSVAMRLLDAGARMVGKTHTEEMAFSLTGENAHYGTPTNPAAPGRVPGGSSSGSAVAVAASLVDFAIGSDTGGSVRAPASFCGIYGIRPTHGRIAMDGAAPLAPGFDTCGWFTRDAALFARVGEVLFGTQVPREVPRVRLLRAEDAFALARPEAAAALAPAEAQLAALFGPATATTVSDTSLRDWFEVFRTLQHGEIRDTHEAWINETHPTFGPQIATRFLIVLETDRDEVGRMVPRRAAIRAHLDALLADGGVLVLPPVPDIAPPCNLPPADTVNVRERALSLLCIAGLGGLPQVTLPVATVDGCPMGISLLGARGSDEVLLAMAQRFADAYPMRITGR